MGTQGADVHIGFLRDSIRLDRAFYKKSFHIEAQDLLNEAVSEMDSLITEFERRLNPT